MTERTYAPTGTGLCATCGHDVGRHIDPAHKFVPFGYGHDICDAVLRVTVVGAEYRCCQVRDHTIHDVGRVLRCPEEAAHD